MRRLQFKLPVFLLVPIACAIAGLAVLLADPLPIQTLRNALFDQYQRWQPRPYVDVPVRIIDLDDESLARLGQWPWPRTRIAELVNRLRQAGTAAIGFDVVFAEPDRTSPAAMSRLWGLQGEVARAVGRLPDHDTVLAESLKAGGVVLGFALERSAAGQAKAAESAPAPYRFIQSGAASIGWLHAFGDDIASLPALTAAAAGRGAIAFVPDSDGVVRRVPLLFSLRGEPVPSLAAETLRVGQSARNYILKSAPAAGTGLQEVRIGDVTVPTTPQGEVWVHYSAAVPQRYIPAWKVLVGEVPPGQLDGSLVLVGTSAQGLQDLRFSPLGRIMPGVEAHAQALEQILTGGGLARPSWASAVEAMVLVAGCAVVGLLAIYTRALLAATLTTLIIGGIVWGGWRAFSAEHLLLDAITPALTVGFTFVLASLVHHLSSERQQRWVKQAFSRYVSPNLVQYLVSHPKQLELGGRRQECSFIFTDLAGFTSLMEKIDPAAAVALLNAYLDQMIGIAFSHHGTLDRIVGDSVAIMFSAPLPQPDHRSRALACALAMDEFATAYSRDLNAKGIHFGITRIGIHSGEVIVGNFGGTTIFDYRALGDPVNTASRLESVNKHLGTRICISANTLAGCPGAVARPVGRLVLKGKTEPLEVLEPVTPNDNGGRAPLDDYRAAYALLAERSAQALPVFQSLAQAYPADPLVALHCQRLLAGEAGEQIVMKEK